MSRESNKESGSGEIEVQIKNPDLIVNLEADYSLEPEEFIEVKMLGRSEDLETPLPIAITFYVAPKDAAPAQEELLLRLPKTEQERDSKIGCRIAISRLAMQALLAIVSSGHRRTFNFAAVNDPKGRGLLIENFEFYLDPKPEPRSIH
ncbi:hypothetical protein [Novosphingobium sp. HII-3]|uniref:hypothetical protein n=1 Tax=Novosphingobium sp. HII-3 TaxID=2075565 RepID=UPI000CDAC7E4|nr:hypothetical protein [Novosphingobium sp. HII-3]